LPYHGIPVANHAIYRSITSCAGWISQKIERRCHENLPENSSTVAVLPIRESEGLYILAGKRYEM